MRLSFAGDDAVVVVDERVRLVDLAGGGETALPLDGARVLDVAAPADQIWIAVRDEAGEAPARLHRFDRAGAAIGAPAELPFAEGRLVAAPQVACAVWSGAQAAAMIALVDGAVVVTPLPERADVLLPYSPQRLVAVRGAVASLRTGGGARWAATVLEPHLRAEAAAFLFDGSSFVVVAATPAVARALAVVTTRDGSVQQRITVSRAGQVLIAERRGQALVRLGDHHLLLVDLRFARTVGEYEHPRPILAVAINGAASCLAVASRGDDGGVVLDSFSPREMVAGGARAAAPAPDELVAAEPGEPEPGEPGAGEPDVADPTAAAATDDRAADASSAAAAASAPADPLRDPPALAPRSRAPRTPRAQARALLEHERTVIATLCYAATARAWDQGRIVWDSDSEHPYETELLGLLDRQRGRADARVADADRAAARAKAELAAATAAAAGTLTPLDELAGELGLSPLARQILQIVAAPTIWGELARLYGILANDDKRAVVDELLVRQILGDVSVHDVARELDPDRPLVARGAIRVGGGAMRPFLSLQVDPLLVARLRGDVLGDGADPQLRVVAATRAPDAMFLPRGLIAHLGDALARAPAASLRLVVRGRVGAGRRTLIAGLAAAANREVAMIDAAPLVRDGRVRGDALADLLRRAALGGWLPCVDNLDVVGQDDRGGREHLREVFRGHHGPIALRLGSDVAPPVEPGYLLVDLPPLAETERLAAWRAALAERGVVVPEADELASRWVVGPGVVHRVVEQVVAAAPGTAPASWIARIDVAIRQHLESRLGDMSSRLPRLAAWSQIVLPPDVLDSLLELVARIRHRRTVFERWGFDRVMSTSRGLTALFQGGPGTGKTMVASAIARELGLDVYRVDLARVVSKWIGETERNLAQLFDAAEDGQAMILFDEADSLFAKRTEVKTSVDRYANLEVNYLLQRLDSFGGIAILTTNFGGAIDAAFKRRLSFRLSFPFPDEEMREQLWRVHLPAEVPRGGELDLGDLARKYKMSGGYIRNAALRAAFLAAAEETGLRQDHLERAVRLEYREIGKLAETGALE